MNWFVTVLKKYAVFSGRAGRPEYWYFFLIYLLASILLLLLDYGTGTYNPKFGIGLFTGIFSLALLLPCIAVSARRLHDIGKSAWWMLIGVIPVIGAIVLLVFACLPSEAIANRFGPGPEPAL